MPFGGNDTIDDTKGMTDVQLSGYDASKDPEKVHAQTQVISAPDDVIDTSFQQGVQNIEAVTLSWSTTSLIFAFVLAWLVYFVQGLVGTVDSALQPYVTSAFAEHSLTATTGVVSSVVGGVTNLSIAKILDVFGRPQGFLLSAILATIGLIMSAACNNVEAYAASQVFYTVGSNGLGYSVSVLIADSTSLRHRGLVQALCASPTIITAWLGGPISTSFLQGAGWRWGFGMGSILLPAVCLPFFGLLLYYSRKAKKQGIAPARAGKRTLWESGSYYVHEFDVPGLLLLSAGVAFFLLPFDLYILQARGWGSSLVISFLVIGVVLLVAFGIWERFFAKVCFVPWHFFKNRTVAGACLLSFSTFLGSSVWLLYMTSSLQVVSNLSVTRANYVFQIQAVVGTVFGILCGVSISYFRTFKPVTLYVSVPMLVLSYGLFIHFFQQPNADVGYICMTLVIFSVGGASVALTNEIAILAAVKEQQYFAIAIALVSMFANIGNAVGYTISSAIWQNTLPKSLAKYLPADQLTNLELIYSDLSTQLSYPPHSPTRTAIQRAYGDAQKWLFTAASASNVLAFAGTLMWENIDVSKMKQTKGRVF